MHISADVLLGVHAAEGKSYIHFSSAYSHFRIFTQSFLISLFLLYFTLVLHMHVNTKTASQACFIVN